MKTRRSCLFLIFAIFVISVVLFCARSSDNFARADENFSGSGSESDPYLIENASDLELLATLTNNAVFDDSGKLYSTRHYKLTSDIDLSGKEFTIGDSSSYIELGYVEVTDFVINHPMISIWWSQYKNYFYEKDGENYYLTDDDVCGGSTSYYFYITEDNQTVNRSFFGSFDGNGRTISNGTQVLFDSIRNASISNLKLTNFNVNGNSLLINSATNSQIISCVVDNGNLNGIDNVGGIVGILSQSENYPIIINSINEIVPSHYFDNYVNPARNSEMALCSSINNKISGENNVGGVVGNCSSNTLVKDCFNSSSIAIESGIGGGLCGSSSGTLSNLLGVFSSENVPAVVSYYPSLVNTSTLYYPIDFCNDSVSTASYRTIELLSETFVSTYLPNWNLPSAIENKLFYPTPNSLSTYGEEFYSITVDGMIFDYVRVTSPTYEIPLPNKGVGYCFENNTDVYYQWDIVTLNGDLNLTTNLVIPSVKLDYSTSTIYNGLAQTVATAHYIHELELTATYQWYYQSGEEFILKSSEKALSLTNVSESGYYKCVVTVSDGTLSKRAESDVALISIDKKSLLVRSYTDINNSVYDGNEHFVTYQYQIDGLAKDDVLTPTPTASGMVNVGEYPLTFVVDDDSNYNITCEYGTYTISNANLSYEINSYSGIYDGKAHGVIVDSVVTVDDCSYHINYSTNNVDYLDSVTLTNAGNLVVYVKITAPNHNEAVISRNIVISKCTVSVALNKSDYPDITKIYDGTYVCDVNLIKDEHIRLSYDSAYAGASPITVSNANFARSTVIARTNVTVYFALSDAKNFVLGTQSLVLGGCSITPAEVKIIKNESVDSVTKRYDGNTDYPINQLPSNMYTIETDCPVTPIVNVHDATFNSKNVSDAISVHISFSVVSSCYYFADGYNGFDIAGSIIPKVVSVDSIAAINKVFDGTKEVDICDYQLSGMIDGDSVSLSYEQALSESENASETQHSVTISGLTIDNDNYVLDYTTAYTTVFISKADPIVNPIVEDVTLYVSSTLLPAISLSSGDTEGTLEWAEYVIDTSGEIPYQWNFYSSSTNYNDKSGTIVFTINDVIPTSIRATSNSSSNEYMALSSFKVNTIEVLLIYNDGTTSILNVKSDIREGYTIEYSTDNKYFVYGDTFITVRYGEFFDTIDIVVNKIVVTKPTIYGQYTYNGNEQTLAMSNFDTALFVADGNKRTNAGTTEVIIRLKDEINYCFDDGSSSFVHLWTINPRSVSQPYLRDANSQYDGTEKEIEVVNPTQKTYYTFTGDTTALNQGEYNIVVSLTDKVNNVWFGTNSSEDIVLTYTITSKPIEKPIIYNLPYVYNGSEQNANYDTSIAYTVSGDTTYLNAGEYSISANLLNIYDGEELVHKNYVWEDGTYDTVTLTYKVGKITVNVPNINTRFEYNGKTHRLPLENNFNYTVSGSVAEINAGSYQAILTLSDDINFVWADGTTEDKVISYRILRKTIQIPTVLGDSVYSGYEMTALIPQSQYYTLLGNTATAVGSHTAKASLNNKLNYQWSDGTTDDITLTYKIVKRVIDIPDAPESLWYNGFPQVAHIGSDEAYVISGNTATDPGTYTATISLKDKDNYLWKDGTSEDVKYTYYVYSVSFSEDSTPTLNNSFSANSELYTPVKDGFNFAGWYDNPYYEGERITSITNPKPDLILYAKWELIEYKEPINIDDGKKGGLGTNAILGLSIAGGALVIALLIIGVGFVLKRR